MLEKWLRSKFESSLLLSLIFFFLFFLKLALKKLYSFSRVGHMVMGVEVRGQLAGILFFYCVDPRN